MGEGLEEKPVDSKNHKQVLCPDRIVNKWFQPYIPYRHLLHWNGVKAKFWCMRRTANTMVENDWRTANTMVENDWRTANTMVENDWRTANTMVENDWPTQERELKLKLLFKTYQERGMRLSTFQYQHFKVTDSYKRMWADLENNCMRNYHQEQVADNHIFEIYKYWPKNASCDQRRKW